MSVPSDMVVGIVSAVVIEALVLSVVVLDCPTTTCSKTKQWIYQNYCQKKKKTCAVKKYM